MTTFSFVKVFSLSLAVSTLAPLGASAAIIDSYLPGDRSQSNGNSASLRHAQSFVAEVTDSIGSIGLIVEFAAPNAQVDIFAVQPGTDLPTGSSLASAYLAAGVGTVPDGNGFAGAALDDMSYFVLNAPFPVQAGDKYAIVLTSDLRVYAKGGFPNNPDTDLSFSEDNGATWSAYAGGGIIDIAFVVSSEIPEPATLSLLAVAGALGLRRFRRRPNQ